MAEIDNLQINVTADVRYANRSLNTLAKNLEKIANELFFLEQVDSNLVKIGASFNATSSNVAKATTTTKKYANTVKQTTEALKKQKSMTTSLASTFGKLYASYFLVIRGAKQLKQSMEDAMGYVETYNYYSVAMNKIGQDFALANGEIGKESGKAYTEAFMNEINNLDAKMTGYEIGKTGELVNTGNLGLGVDPNAMMNFQARIGAVTNSVGLLGQTSVDVQKALSMLSADLSSLTNTDVSSVMTNLSSGLIGQSRALYRFGLDITNNTLQQLAWANGIEKSVSAMTQSEKMQLRILAIIQQSTVAHGDMANTISSSANMYRVLGQQVQNTSRIIGNLFLPILQKGLPMINGFMVALNETLSAFGYKLWGDSWLTQLQDGISQGSIAPIEDLGDEVDDTTESVKALQNQLASFDKINKLSDNSSSSSSKNASGGGLIDLSQQINSAVADYESVWQKAFDNMNNEAEGWAEKFKGIFGDVKEKLKDYAPFFKALGDGVKVVYNALKPFVKGVGEGLSIFFQGLVTIGTPVIKGIADALGLFVDLGNKSGVIQSLGVAVGVVGGALLTIGAATTLATKISGIATSVKALLTVLTSHPLTVIAVGVGAVFGALYKGLFKKEDYDALYQMSDGVKEFIGATEELSEAHETNLKNIEGNFGYAKSIADKYIDLSNRFSTLNDSEKALFKMYADEMKELFPELADAIGDGTEAFKDNTDRIYENIQAMKDHAKMEAYKDYLKQLYQQEVKLKGALEDKKTQYDRVRDSLYEYFKNMGGYTAKVADQAYETGNLSDMLQILEEKHWSGRQQTSLFKDMVGMTAEEVGTLAKDVEGLTTELENNQTQISYAETSMKDYGERMIETKNRAADIREELTKMGADSTDVRNIMNTDADTLVEHWNSKQGEFSKIGGDFFESFKGSILAKNPGQFVKDQLQEMVDNANAKYYGESLGATFGNGFANKISGMRVEIEPKMTGNIMEDLFAESSPRKINPLFTTKVSFKANGGFVDKGQLFIAREAGAEMVGSIGNQTAVANNYQIENGIAKAVYGAISNAMQNFGNTTVVLEGDAKNMFKVVQNQAKDYTRQTGMSAFPV